MTLEKIIQELHSKAKPANVAGMARFGMVGEGRLGISMPELRKMAKETGRNHLLALALWNTKIPEAMILASIIEEPNQTTQQQLDRWVEGINSWDICDQLCLNLLVKVPFALKRVEPWSKREEEFVKRVPYAFIACAVTHLDEENDFFINFFPMIKAGATDERNFVKKAVNWALRSIGKKNPELNRAALEAAKEIQQLDSRAARWIAADAIRELKSEAIQARLKR